MAKAQYTLVALCFTLGIGLIVLGTTSHADGAVWGMALHTRLTKMVGLLMIVGSLGIFFATFGSVLLRTRYGPERRLGCDGHRTLEQAAQLQATSPRQTSNSEAKCDASQPLVSLARTSTEARLLLAIERKKEADHHTTAMDTNHKTPQAKRRSREGDKHE